jgi:hypothetical protein
MNSMVDAAGLRAVSPRASRPHTGIAFRSKQDLEPTFIQAEPKPAGHGRDGCYVQVSL